MWYVYVYENTSWIGTDSDHGIYTHIQITAYTQANSAWHICTSKKHTTIHSKTHRHIRYGAYVLLKNIHAYIQKRTDKFGMAMRDGKDEPMYMYI